MKELLNATKIVNRVNQLLQDGKKLRVFGLPFPPYYDDLVFTDEKINRTGWLCTSSKIALSVSACATKIKIRTITGWCYLFKYVENGEYIDTMSEDGKYIHMSITDDICHGMLLGVKDDDRVYNIGMIVDILDDENIRKIVTTNVHLNEVSNYFRINEETNYFVLDRII